MGQEQRAASFARTAVARGGEPKSTGSAPKPVDPFVRKNGQATKLFEQARGSSLPGVEERVMGNALGILSGALSMFSPTRGGANELTSPYHESWVVYSCCQQLSKALSSAPLRLYVDDSPEAAEVSPDHPLVRLFADPNPQMTGQQARGAGIVNRKLTGEDVWFLADAEGNPIAEAGETLIPIPTQILSCSGFQVQDERDPQGKITSWRYTGSIPSPKFAPESILHFFDYNPNDTQRGTGAAQVAMRALGMAFQAERHQESVFRSGGPGYFLITEHEVNSDDARREQAELVDRLQASGPAEPKILRGKWDVKPVPGSAKDIGIYDALNWAKDVVCSTFGVPPPIIGLLDQAHFRNMEETWRQFWIGIAGYCHDVEDVLNTQFFPRLNDPVASKFRARFDLSEVDALREDNTASYELGLKMSQAGVGLSMQGAFDLVGVEYDPNIEGLDERFVANTLTPLNPDTAKAIIDAKPPPPPLVAPVGPDGKPPTPEKAPAPAAKSIDHWNQMTPAQREAYWRAFEQRVLLTHDGRLYGRVRHFLVRYEQAQLDLLAHYAGKKPLRALLEKLGLVQPQPIVKATTAELEAQLTLNEAQWASVMHDMVGTGVVDAYQAALEDIAQELGVLQLPMTDPAVQRQLAEQLTQLTEGVNSTLAGQVKAALIRVLGEPSTISDLKAAVRAQLPELTAELQRVFGNKDARALTIARTETGHAAGNARITQMERAGIKTIEWVSAHDSHVRESHQQLDGETRDIGEEFKSDLRWPHDERGPADEVINCFLPGTLVQGSIVAGLRAPYAGEAVEIETARGHVLRVTPNHPVLTAQGWVAAHALREGSQLLSHRLGVDAAVLGHEDDQQGEARVEQVFDALAREGRSRLAVVGALDLHGDASGLVGEVDVVAADGELAHEVGVGEERPHRSLVQPDARGAALHGAGTPQEDLGAVALAASPSPSPSALALHDIREARGVELAELSPLCSFRFGPAADSHAVADEHAKQRSAPDPRLVRELLETLSVDVALDQVVKVRRFFHRGHVFDLQSEVGWILAQGIVSGNCRCIARPIVKGLEP